jgi:predicted RNA-binding Zn ribbon-like protein
MLTIDDLELVGGHPALDFANTIENRLADQPDNLLRSPADLARWGADAGLISSAEPRDCTARELSAALALREHLLGSLDALVAHRPIPATDLRALAREVADAHVAGKLVQNNDGAVEWSWDRGSLAAIRHLVATSASDLLAGEAARRIGRCAGPGCGWFFLDATKRGNRRWCSMRDCGQDAKTARRRASKALAG